MKVIEPSFQIETPAEHLGWAAMRHIERAGRTCYKSEGKATEDSAPGFVERILGKQHESVIEHVSVTVRFVVDRGVSHELVRHRLCAFSQESTRYCNYGQDGFGREITVIRPCFWEEGSLNYSEWYTACREAELSYIALLGRGASAQEARSVLPNSLKTEIVVTTNLREWRHILRLRTSKAAHPQMRQVMIPLARALHKAVPVIFDDIMVPLAGEGVS